LAKQKYLNTYILKNKVAEQPKHPEKKE